MLKGTNWEFLFDYRDEDAIRTYMQTHGTIGNVPLPFHNNNINTIDHHEFQDDTDDDDVEVVDIASDDQNDDHVEPQSATSSLLPQSYNQLGNVHEQIANQRTRRIARNRAINEQFGDQWRSNSGFMFPERDLTRRASHNDITRIDHNHIDVMNRNTIRSAPTLQKSHDHMYLAYPMQLQDARNNIYPHPYDGDRILTHLHTIWTSTLDQYPDGILIFMNTDVEDFFTIIDEIFGYDSLVQIELSDSDIAIISEYKNIRLDRTEIFDPDDL
jgi:hypothetical protein